MDYSYSQWLGVLEYFGLIFALGTGVCFISAKATYMCFGKSRKSKVRIKSNTKKKQVFFDVA